MRQIDNFSISACSFSANLITTPFYVILMFWIHLWQSFSHSKEPTLIFSSDRLSSCIVFCSCWTFFEYISWPWSQQNSTSYVKVRVCTHRVSFLNHTVDRIWKFVLKITWYVKVTNFARRAPRLSKTQEWTTQASQDSRAGQPETASNKRDFK